MDRPVRKDSSTGDTVKVFGPCRMRSHVGATLLTSQYVCFLDQPLPICFADPKDKRTAHRRLHPQNTSTLKHKFSFGQCGVFFYKFYDIDARGHRCAGKRFVELTE